MASLEADHTLRYCEHLSVTLNLFQGLLAKRSPIPSAPLIDSSARLWVRDDRFIKYIEDNSRYLKFQPQTLEFVN